MKTKRTQNDITKRQIVVTLAGAGPHTEPHPATFLESPGQSRGLGP